jgi:diguanylate cyclase (GGDEF)-like protein
VVDLADSGTEALRLGQQHTYAVVVTDLRMPGMDGFTVIERLQGVQPDAAFVVVTGVPEIDLERMKDLNGAVCGIVSKPWDDLMMMTALSRALELKTDEAQPSPSPTGKVLVLEDSPGDAHLISEHLSHLPGGPRTVHVVGLLSEAIAVLHDEAVDVVLVDLSLPDAVGLDVVRRVTTAGPGAAIVILTGMEDDGLALRAIQLGAQDYLAKGVDGPALRRAVRHALERKRASLLLTQLAHRDPLTGLANRLTFRDRLAHAMAVARRASSKAAVVYVDLDRFKPVNDTFGHEVGDGLLREVATRLQAAVRGSDAVSRLGGDEFGVIVENIQDEGQLTQVLDRLRVGLVQQFFIDGHAIEVSASLGVAVFPGAGATGDDLIRAADRAMYRAKQRNGFSCEIAA